MPSKALICSGCMVIFFTAFANFAQTLAVLYQFILVNCYFCSFWQPHLGEFPERLFTDKAAEDAISRFKENLDKVSKEIKDRNNKSAFPYTYLLPENTPNSVAI